MQTEEFRRHSRWMMRVMEWDDARARYPNIWHAAMPRHVLAYDRVASRLRLGDLIAVFYPASQRHPERSERFLGLSRVSGLRLADQPGFAWVDLGTVHRFEPPLELDRQPRRVFLCCDPGWPAAEVALFRRIFDAAVAAGWRPEELDLEATPTDVAATPEARQEHTVETAVASSDPAPSRPLLETPPPVPAPVPPDPSPGAATPGRLFAGVNFGGDMRDPRDATWLAVLELRDERLSVRRLEATGRHGLQRYLRDPDPTMMHVEAVGLDFPFGLPVAFAESLLGGPFPDEGWWALAKRMEKLSRPDYLVALQDFREASGEARRHTDEVAGAHSPLHRAGRDLGPLAYHGIRMIAEDRSRYAVKPFESAQGRLLIEVYPEGFLRSLVPPAAGDGRADRERRRGAIDALAGLYALPVLLDDRADKHCMAHDAALAAVVAARMVASAVCSGEVERTPEELAPGIGDRVRREGWIYGMAAGG